jgi:hypothetical protein
MIPSWLIRARLDQHFHPIERDMPLLKAACQEALSRGKPPG